MGELTLGERILVQFERQLVDVIGQIDSFQLDVKKGIDSCNNGCGLECPWICGKGYLISIQTNRCQEGCLKPNGKGSLPLEIHEGYVVAAKGKMIGLRRPL